MNWVQQILLGKRCLCAETEVEDKTRERMASYLVAEGHKWRYTSMG